MSNSPRKVGKLAPPYLPKLTDDSGNLISMIGVNASAFSITFTDVKTEQPLTGSGTGTWSIVTDPLDGIVKPSYAYAAADMATPGTYLVTVSMLQANGTTLAFDPDLLIVDA